jgi:3-oxoacyl-[acyl-carrier-protein] synthase III
MLDQLDCSIESLGVYLPGKVVSTAEFLSSCNENVRRAVEAMTGIKSRCVAGDAEYSIDLARNAILRCLAGSRYTADDVELLIVCTICRCDGPELQFSYEPNTSFQLARELNLRNALTIDVSNACAGMFTGIAIARSFIANGAVGNALVVSGEYISHIALTAQKEISGIGDPRLASLTLGDAGAAVLLERSSSPQVGFLDLELYTLSSHSNLCVAQPSAESHGGIIMMTDAAKMAAVALREGIDHSADVISRNNWSASYVDHWIAHQTSRKTIGNVKRAIEARFGIDFSKSGSVVDNLSQRGNTASTSHFVALADQIDGGKIRSGNRILFGVSASGLTIGTALYVLDDLPGRRLQPDSHRRPRSDSARSRPYPPRVDSRPKVRVESVGMMTRDSRARMTDIESAKNAIDHCLCRSGYTREQIDLVVFCGVYRSGFVFEPAIASLLACEAGIANEAGSDTASKRAFAFDVFNGALGFLSACTIAAQMIAAGSYRTALIVASETDGDLEDGAMNFRGVTKTASAVILDQSKGEGPGFEAFSFRNFPEYEHAFEARAWVRPGKTELRYKTSGDIHEAYLECIERAVPDFLARERLELSQIAFILGPQLGPGFSRRLGSVFNFPENRIVDIGRDGEDLFTSSFPYALHHLYEKGLVRPGDLALAVAVGPGIQVGCAAYRF